MGLHEAKVCSGSENTILSAGEEGWRGRGLGSENGWGRHLVFSETEQYDVVTGLPQSNRASNEILGQFIGGI